MPETIVRIPVSVYFFPIHRLHRAAPCVYCHGMKKKDHDALPTKAVVSEISRFRKTLRAAMASNQRRLESGLESVREKVAALESDKKISDGRARDLRDMLTVLRSHKIDPAKGRRKDLKKIDSLVEDLAMLCERW
jgi:hypothetical protein